MALENFHLITVGYQISGPQARWTNFSDTSRDASSSTTATI